MQAFLATCFTWGVTALGAAGVFFFKEVNRKVLDFMLGFTAGVMIAASYWSLLAPAIEMSVDTSLPSWFPAATGFLMGGLFLRIIDKIIPHLHIGFPKEEAEGIKTDWQKTILLFLAITLHNIPEGLAIGVAFGAAAAGLSTATLAGAITLAVGIGIQNFPEGFAISVPIRRTGASRLKSFWYGQLSAVVEPIAAVVGAMVVTLMKPTLPYALAFAAGAMIFVTIEEVVPESQKGNHTDLATFGTMLGFVIMMVLDVAFG
ncbi:dihydroorotate dehydrogenase [Candidatus Roizmanbacteria bacterium RIFOXYB2_FULL_41_10]|uniref:Dihydroorotate dehydrogenase n=1 Tax=Candidatus Roizmanbacteria bacterium RIFOXYA1_FULL_41_12 TaxID=1802082 RepID=A0A1F7K9H6_9BACT|nr:MAG: dihydroorotate dehydrogenase [Candidatus Roizmanbacteria bacterium RIFOXYA1_FULL_41_12]OGK65026.1 MAG: dihydroorotate dehydrogenase [Candidatus Roizmanbacteria bacterium RIFOXYA2_FULL_41_8]OGK67298.1 MAG: dihydroorotate dehydrogenase [Candidatus Roizmanbacteria bacterium RIFOXYB1_FULL_41_27]OGK69156.1 MAG: dihydroorotate dehydrogenase [Candidatus Roizmanbacteria bacterium RIFOXYB2_FULL_41_10]OGK71831.1 MAG: dihydroorotate dehydrogenase [Candidatus Roizmanbacteria bacterium RIFOXYC1_FULL